MSDPQSDNPLFTAAPQPDEPLLAAVERALARRDSPLDQLPTLTNVALGDPYLAEQLAALRAQFPLRPPEARGLLGRLRARLAWRLLGPELDRISTTHATLLRLLDSLVVLIDEERSARRRIEEHITMNDER